MYRQSQSEFRKSIFEIQIRETQEEIRQIDLYKLQICKLIEEPQACEAIGDDGEVTLG